MQQQWSVMEQMYKANKTRAIGVSNYCKACLDCIAKTGTIVPHVNQIQLHVGMGISTITQGLTALCKQRGIVPQARKKTTKPMCLEAVIVVTVQHGKCTSSALQQQPTQAASVCFPHFSGPPFKRVPLQLYADPGLLPDILAVRLQRKLGDNRRVQPIGASIKANLNVY